MLTNQSGPSGQIGLTFSNAKVSVNLTILHPLILTLIIPIQGNVWKRVANFRHKLVTFPYSIMIKLRAIGLRLFSVQSCRTSNYVRSVAVSWFQSDVCFMERLRKKFNSNYVYESR